MQLAQVIKKYSSMQKESTVLDSIGQKDAMQLHFPNKHAPLTQNDQNYTARK